MTLWLGIAVAAVVVVGAFLYWLASDPEEVDQEEEAHVEKGDGEKYNEHFELDPNQNPNELYGGGE